MKNKTFYFISLSFFVGIFAASFIYIPVWFFIFLVIIFSVGILLFRNKPSVRFCFIIIISFSLGAIRFGVSGNNNHPLDKFLGKKAEISGIVCAEPEEKELNQRLCFAPIIGGDRVVVSTPRFPRYGYGEKLSLSGVLKLPENFEAYPGGPEFDYVSYLEKDGIRYTMSIPQVKKLGEGFGNPVVSFLIKIKSAFMNNVESLLPEPHSSFVGGLLLGEKGSLPPDVSLAFKRSGLTHILVLSGSNVTVVAESLLRIFNFLPRSIGQSLGAGSIILFALMTGASATTVRATFMTLTVLLVRGAGRGYDVTRSLIIAGFIMLLQNPKILAFDISFQLSFLATLAIIYVSPLVKDRLVFVTERFGIRETLAMTVSSQIFTLPFILYKMGEISVIALIPNLLVLQIVPYAMLGGFVLGVMGFINYFLALPFAWITQSMLSYMLKTVALFGPLSFATFKITIGPTFLFVSYALYTALLIYLWRQKNSFQQSPS